MQGIGKLFVYGLLLLAELVLLGFGFADMPFFLGTLG